MNELFVTIGTEVKALGNGKVGGYLVRFSTKKDPDLAGDFFTAETDFDIDFSDPSSAKSTAYFDHCMDETLGQTQLGVLDAKGVASKAQLGIDDVGVWIEHQLDVRDEYQSAIYQLAKKGKLGWSSGTAKHLVARESKGTANWVKTWPLGKDASYTPTPCEPRTAVLAVKSIVDADTFNDLKSGLMQSDKRKMLKEACDDLLSEGYVEEYDDDTVYFYSYGAGTWAVPYSMPRGKLTLGTPTKVTPKVVYESTTKSISGTPSPHGETFADLTVKTLDVCREFVARAADYSQLKANSGRPISAERESDFKSVHEQLKEIVRLCPSEARKALVLDQMRLEAELLDLSLI